MTSTTVAEFAAELKKPTETLLEQLKGAGVAKSDAGDALSDADKQKLLAFLQNSHGTSTGERKKITLVKKSTSEIKQADATGKARTIQVEVRKKRTFVKREDEVGATVPVEEPVQTPSEPVIDQAELARREEEARRQAELLRRQEEELAERRRQREEQEAREKAAEQQALQAQVAAAEQRDVSEQQARAEADAAMQAQQAKEQKAAQAAADEVERARDLDERRRKALAEAEAIRAMMNAPKRVMTAKKEPSLA
jgi:translation initiation factor IF-2